MMLEERVLPTAVTPMPSLVRVTVSPRIMLLLALTAALLPIAVELVRLVTSASASVPRKVLPEPVLFL
ncbi:MAG: hypothetical protein IPH78_14290 [Bacteroidetes bacterium]|nr:hypothetical protein [Bacteroidota bacterium]